MQVLYTIPTGANPSGATLSDGRRREIYDICREHDCLIIEDDPYYFLQFSENRKPSFFSMDEDGRVLRFDSFSKLISSGIRIGFVTGPKDLIERINLHSQASNLHASGLSQAVIHCLLNEWGISPSSKSENHVAFEEHVAQVRSFYHSQRNMFCDAAESVGLSEVVNYSIPTAGMFSWMHVHDHIGIDDTAVMLKERAPERKFLMVPGSAFFVGNPPSRYMRAAFSTASGTEMKTALERLKGLLQETAKY